MFRRILIIIFLISLLMINLMIGNTFSIAQEIPVKVSVRQIGTSVYFYKVLNISNNPIASLLMGYNCNLKNTDIEESELTIEPTVVESPTGWKGYPVFVEESEYLHIYWRVLDHAYSIPPGGSLDGFMVYMPQPYDLMKQTYFTVIYSSGSLVESCAKVQIDNDNDGYTSDIDCDDNNSAINPGEPEICDGIDNNCNGQIDEGVKNTYYHDADNDTYGNPAVSIQACTPPSGYVTNNTDCNDTNPSVNPGATEGPVGSPTCNDTEDNDCDGTTDIYDTNCYAPDLVETSVSNPPSSAKRDNSFTVTDTASNQGTASSGGSTTLYYLSLDITKDASDTLLTGTRSVPILSPGKSSTGSAAVTIPSIATGYYYLLACADDTGIVTEHNETNNCIASQTKVQIIGPDLVETSVSNPPATAKRSSKFSVTDTVKNQGTESTGSNSTTRYYLSLDTIWDASDMLLSNRSVPKLAAGASSTGSKTVTIPTIIPLGSYYLLACADDAKKVNESSETNNCIASQTRLQINP